MQGRVLAAEPIPAVYQALQYNIRAHAAYCKARGRSLHTLLIVMKASYDAEPN